MPTLRARYAGTCPVCGFAIERGQLIKYDPRNGVRAQHEDCEALKRRELAEAEQRLSRGAQLAAWQDRNPMPVLEHLARAAGAPRLDLSLVDTDEERRCALGRHDEEIGRWMAVHPEVRQEFERLSAEWEARRAAFVRQLDEQSVSGTMQSHSAPCGATTQRARTR